MTKLNDGTKSEQSSARKASRFRRILPQVIATSIKNFHILDWGLMLAMPSILIPSVTGIKNEQNRGETISITGAQASWLVSFGFVVQIFGSLASGFLTDPLGRKRAMILVNIPFAIGWFMLYQSTEVWHIFFGFTMLGLAVGLMESSVITYLGEICEPSTRGILIAYTCMSGAFGTFIIYILNAWMPWRHVALACLAVPVTSAISLCFVPESPHWLLSKKRTKQAEQSLRWLRGWVPKQAVAHEFYELQRHIERSNACYTCTKQDVQCTHPLPTLVEKLAELKRKQTLKPFVIVASLFFLVQFTGAFSMRSYLVQIFKAYESPISSDEIMMIIGFSDNLANVIFMCLIRFTGKRRIFLAMIFVILFSSLVISCYGFVYLPRGFTSFDLQNQSFQLENKNLAYIPTICIFVWNFCTYCGFITMPWMLLSELFSFKSRVIVSGIAAALDYIMGFISRKTYYNFETTFSMPGASLIYSIIAGVGLISMYFILPETEDRSLEDIELHFSDNSKKLTDWKIANFKAIAEKEPLGVLSNQQLFMKSKDAEKSEK